MNDYDRPSIVCALNMALEVYRESIQRVLTSRMDADAAAIRLDEYDRTHTEGQTCSPTPTPSSD